MNPNRYISNFQGAVYQYTYNAKMASGVCLQTITDYSPFGATLDGRAMQGNGYRYGFNGMEKDDEVKGEGNSSTTEYRQLDTRLGRWLSIDPLTKSFSDLSPFNAFNNNPIRLSDITGMAPNDFVKRKDGSIYWDKNANSKTTTKAGETYLGKTLTFKFNSYIDKKNWDGPTLGGLIDPSGDKLTSTLTLTGNENHRGELTSISAGVLKKLGETPIGTARYFYPGEGGSNNVFSLKGTETGINLNFEQHASVSPSEEILLNSMGYKIVDVAQKLTINYTSNTGMLSVSAYTNVFPSATLKINGISIMQYNQPSFIATHTAPIKGWTTPNPYKDHSIPRAIKDFSYYPSVLTNVIKL